MFPVNNLTQFIFIFVEIYKFTVFTAVTRVPVTLWGRVLTGSASPEFFAIFVLAGVSEPETDSLHVSSFRCFRCSGVFSDSALRITDCVPRRKSAAQRSFSSPRGRFYPGCSAARHGAAAGE